MALLFFGLGALARLLVGPVSLGPFSGELADAISNSLPGLAVRYDDAALQWSRDEGRVNLVILGARVFDRSQRIIAQAPRAEIDLAAAPLLQGRVVVRRMALVGVQLTMVHTMDGALRLGVEGDRGQSDVLERLREALQSSKGSATSLTSFAVRKARLAFYDERTGLFVVAPQASLTVSTSGGKSAALAASVDADIEVSGHRAYLQARLTLPPDGQTVTGDISLHGFDVNALGENAKALAFLKPYALKGDITGSFTLDQGSTHVRAVDFGVGAAGIVHGFGHPVHVKTLRLVGRYDGRTGRLLIDDGVLAGNEARAHLYGDGHLKFNSAGGLETSSVDLTMDKIGVDMPGVMQRAMTLARIALQASYTPADNRIVIDKFLMFGGNLSASLTGEVDLFPGETPKIALNGHIAPLDVANLLHYWPLQLGQGAREWIAANILGGTIGPMALKADIAAGALDLPVLPDGAINLSFPIANATVNYLQGLTPLTNMQGSATLTGDTFTATVTSAKIGPLALSGGSVTIPNLHVAGSPGNIVAHVDGALSDVLTLIDMPPLHYPTRFHIGTDSAKGQAAIDLSFRVPMVKDLSIDDVGIKIGGQVRGLALAVGDHEVTNGVANLAIDNSSLHLDGDIVMAGASLKASWDEAFAAKGPITTHITASGVLDDAARKKLNFHSGDFIKGPVNIDATLDGHRGSITKAAMAMDLTPATVTIGLINYKKAPGVSADVQVTAQFKDGAISGTDITADGAGLQLQGQAGFGPGGTLAMLDFPIVRAGQKNDFSLHMSDAPGVGLKVSVTGRSADGTGLGRTDLTGKKADNSTSEPAQSGKHFEIEANLDRLVMRSGVTMAPFAFSSSGTGDRPQTMALTGRLSKTATLSGDLVAEGGEREIRLRTSNAGLLFKGLFGFTSLHGGKLDLVAALSPKPTKDELAKKQAPDYRGVLKITNFTVVNQPFLTRLFSAGSLGGLSDLLQDKGIAVDTLDAPFRMHGGVLDIHDARASGPSIGITAQGYLDRRNSKIALEGALAPIFGLNSVLGAIPVLGDVLVSKKGEGIIGMSYSVSGNADEPRISVNPLSVLTPGILRRIFEGTPEAPRTIAPKATAKPPAGADKAKPGAPPAQQQSKESAPPSKPDAAPAKTEAASKVGPPAATDAPKADVPQTKPKVMQSKNDAASQANPPASTDVPAQDTAPEPATVPNKK